MTLMKAWRRLRTTHPWWIENEDEGVLVDLNSGRVIGRYLHDGYGKWEIDVCLPYWRAWRLIRTQPAAFVMLANFPRCWISLFRARSVESAQTAIERFAGKVIIEWVDQEA